MQTLAILQGLGHFALFLAALGFIIFVHELGHFMTAKWVGIKVEQFAVGFGHVVVSWRKGLGLRFGSTRQEVDRRIHEHLTRSRNPLKDAAEQKPAQDAVAIDKAREELGIGETEYSLRWFPLGGFVKMLGQEDLDPAAVSDDPRSYNRKPIWARMIVVSAGVVMNIIFAVVFFIAAFMWGVEFPPAVVGDVTPGSPAATAVATNDPAVIGQRPGDRIQSINGKPTSDFPEIRVNTALSKAGQPIDLIVERPAFGGEEKRTLRFTLTPQTSEDRFLQIGVSQARSTQLAMGETRDDQQFIDSTLAKFDLKQGMILTKVNNEPVDAHWQYLLMLDQSHGQAVQLTFEDENGGEVTTTVQPESDLMAIKDEAGNAVKNHMLGFTPATRVKSLAENAAAAGQLEVGDLIQSINGIDWPTTRQFVDAVGNADSSVAITVIRDGRTVDVTVTPRPTRWGLFGRRLLGVTVESAKQIATVDGTPAGALGIMSGSRIINVAGQPVESLGDIRRAVEAADSNDITVTYIEPLLGGIEGTAVLTLDETTRDELAALKWRDPIGLWQPHLEMQKADTPMEALAIGYDKTVIFLQQTYITILRLTQGSVSPKHLSGPVGITHVGMNMADRGWSYLFWFMGLISVNLAVINFLPLPIVDGGLFVMLVLEKIRGKPLPLNVQSAVTLAGVVLLGAVFLFVTFNDLQRLFGG